MRDNRGGLIAAPVKFLGGESMRIRITSGSNILFRGNLNEEHVHEVMEMIRTRAVTDEKLTDIITKVCEYKQITLEGIKSKERLRKYVEGRALVFYRCMDTLGYTAAMAGAVFGKDHCTALYAKQIVRNYLKQEYKEIFGEEI